MDKDDIVCPNLYVLGVYELENKKEWANAIYKDKSILENDLMHRIEQGYLINCQKILNTDLKEDTE